MQPHCLKIDYSHGNAEIDHGLKPNRHGVKKHYSVMKQPMGHNFDNLWVHVMCAIVPKINP